MNNLFFCIFLNIFLRIKLYSGSQMNQNIQLCFFEDDIAIKWEPFSFSFDKLTIKEKHSSSNVGILSIENVPRYELLILSIKWSIYTLLIPSSSILVIRWQHLNVKIFSDAYSSWRCCVHKYRYSLLCCLFKCNFKIDITSHWGV